MNDFKIIKCPACGSSNIENQGESIVTCSHCGSKLLLKNKYSNLESSNRDIKKLLFIVTTLVILIAVLVLWLLTKNNAIQPKIETKLSTKNPLIGQPLQGMPKINVEAIKIFNQEVKSQKKEMETPKIVIVSKIKAYTSIGGLYWILQIRNEGQYTVSRPSVVVSLFNDKNQRIGEHVGWPKLSHLDKNQTTEVLVLISKPPAAHFTEHITARAYNTGSFDRHLEVLEIKDFVINKDAKNKRKAEIVGDVYNPNLFQLDFVMVMAVAKNNKGMPVGLADAYATTPSIPAQGLSGFKVTAGTFVAEKPASWSVYAIGSKHRGN